MTDLLQRIRRPVGRALTLAKLRTIFFAFSVAPGGLAAPVRSDRHRDRVTASTRNLPSRSLSELPPRRPRPRFAATRSWADRTYERVRAADTMPKLQTLPVARPGRPRSCRSRTSSPRVSASTTASRHLCLRLGILAGDPPEVLPGRSSACPASVGGRPPSYGHGYFPQALAHLHGWQLERYPDADPFAPAADADARLADGNQQLRPTSQCRR